MNCSKTGFEPKHRDNERASGERVVGEIERGGVRRTIRKSGRRDRERKRESGRSDSERNW